MKHEDYTVGLICPLPKEAAAILLDEHHEKQLLERHDATYMFGCIDVHNVVIACLPTMGTNAAAHCATRLHSGFTSLRFILMVGIGGGVPTKHDIRLGDVVVGMPGKTHRGVVQYDYGTKFQDEHLKISDAQLNRPPDVLLTAVHTLSVSDAQTKKGNTGLEYRLHDYVNSLVDQYPKLSESKRPEIDQLFLTDYLHLDNDLPCEKAKCDPGKVKDRTARKDDKLPHIHHGLIASGNEVMRDAKERDRLAREHDILCFEMEAAGLMVDIGCLIIRGICDYCDSHKNKVWQGYAAAVAAAYAKELLRVISGLEEKERKDNTSQSEARGEEEKKSSFHISTVNTSGSGRTFIGNKFQSGGSINF